MGFRVGLNPDEFKVGCNYKGGCAMRPLSIYFVHLFLIVVLFNWYAKDRLLVCPCCLKCVTVTVKLLLSNLRDIAYRVNGACRYFCF